MGGVDVGESGGKKKRATNSEINMIPFIDLLMCTIAFLLITAVWVTNSRMNADAQVPGPPDPQKELNPQTPEKVLHLHIGENEFSLVWKQGATVISENKVPKTPLELDSGEGGKVLRFPDLAKKSRRSGSSRRATSTWPTGSSTSAPSTATTGRSSASSSP